MSRAVLLAPVLIAAALACLPARAENFDGGWQVTITTEHGTCDKAYSYPVSVKEGTVSYAGETPAKVAGKVSGTGEVDVRISLGDKQAEGMGRLTATGGGGTWKSAECSGKWNADRKV